MVAVVLGLVAIFVAMALPRQREAARDATCRRNLREIGIALVIYDQARGVLPAVGPLPGGTGPLGAMLGELGLADFRGLDAERPQIKPGGLPPAQRIIPGFACPSDPAAFSGRFPAPTSYRACTGDTSDGLGGAFANGPGVKLAQVEAADGLSYTAAFAERLVGTGSPTPNRANYAVAPCPIGPTCPPALPDQWQSDAGSSWVVADWRSTLYHHGLAPNAKPSCLDTAGRTAGIGASSGHLDRANVLLLDGSVRAYRSGIDLKVWRRVGTVREAEAGP